MKLDNDSTEMNLEARTMGSKYSTTISSNLIGALAVLRAAPDYWVVFILALTSVRVPDSIQRLE